MTMNKKKKPWVRPELVIIDRLYKEESVLLSCMGPGTIQVPGCASVEQGYTAG